MARGLIACVLRSGGDFGPEHVLWLWRQCTQHMPDWGFTVWTDTHIGLDQEVRLQHSWPKWWAKFEAYHDTCEYDWPMLMIDLDTVFLKTLEIRPSHAEEILIIRDPWKDGCRHPERLAGGFMYLPAWARRELWGDFARRGPESVIGEFGGDDQPYLHKMFSDRAIRFQDEYVDEIVSFKAHVRGIGIQPENKVVYFHGEPRPWNVKADWIPPLGDYHATETKRVRYQEEQCSG